MPLKKAENPQESYNMNQKQKNSLGMGAMGGYRLFFHVLLRMVWNAPDGLSRFHRNWVWLRVQCIGRQLHDVTR